MTTNDPASLLAALRAVDELLDQHPRWPYFRAVRIVALRTGVDRLALASALAWRERAVCGLRDEEVFHTWREHPGR